MSVTYLNPDSLPEPIGTYSHVTIAPPGYLVTISGQLANDRRGVMVGDDLYGQTLQVFANLEAALTAVGLRWSNVLRLNTYLSQVAGAADGFYRGRQEYFAQAFADGGYPAHTMVVVNALADPSHLLEIDALAVADPDMAGPGTP